MSKEWQVNIVILDVELQPIIEISSPGHRKTIKLIYMPPCHAYQDGHYHAYVDGEMVDVRGTLEYKCDHKL